MNIYHMCVKYEKARPPLIYTRQANRIGSHLVYIDITRGSVPKRDSGVLVTIGQSTLPAILYVHSTTLAYINVAPPRNLIKTYAAHLSSRNEVDEPGVLILRVPTENSSAPSSPGCEHRDATVSVLGVDENGRGITDWV